MLSASFSFGDSAPPRESASCPRGPYLKKKSRPEYSPSRSLCCRSRRHEQSTSSSSQWRLVDREAIVEKMVHATRSTRTIAFVCRRARLRGLTLRSSAAELEAPVTWADDHEDVSGLSSPGIVTGVTIVRLPSQEPLSRGMSF